MTRVYYNDSDAFVCAWLKNLIAAGHLPAGDVDERPIEQVQPGDVAGYDQCHFFAGIGGWAYALQLAGWGDRPVWSGSCPCQPFSAAGKGKAEDDPRHLWPHWFRLIKECKPERIFGEQVANAAGHGWWDVVSTDLEAEAYTVGAVVLGAHSVGAPHARQRLWFVADAGGQRARGRVATQKGPGEPRSSSPRQLLPAARPNGGTNSLADTDGGRCEQCDSCERAVSVAYTHSTDDAPENPECNGRRSRGAEREGQRRGPASDRSGFWGEVEWLECRDGERRPTRAGLFPLAHGVPNRVGTLRGAGNAIVPQTAAAFVSAYMEVSSRDTPPFREEPPLDTYCQWQ